MSKINEELRRFTLSSSDLVKLSWKGSTKLMFSTIASPPVSADPGNINVLPVSLQLSLTFILPDPGCTITEDTSPGHVIVILSFWLIEYSHPAEVLVSNGRTRAVEKCFSHSEVSFMPLKSDNAHDGAPSRYTGTSIGHR